MKLTQSLSGKMIMSLTVIMLVVSLVFTLISYWVSSQRLEKNFEDELASAMNLAKITLVEPVFSYDFTQVDGIAKAMVHTPLFAKVNVVDQRGKVLGTEDISDQKDVALERTIDITRDNNKIGELSVGISNAQLVNQRHAMLTLLVLIFICLLLGTLITTYLLLKRLVTNPVQAVTQSLSNIARGEGDLTQRLPIHSKDEIAELANNFNLVLNHLGEMIRSVKDAAVKIDSNVDSLSGATDSTSTSTNQQLREIEQVATALQEMAHSASEIASHAAATADRTQDTTNLANTGAQIVVESMDTINNLTEQIGETAEKILLLKNNSETIGTVVEVIRNIADQTNLLALNAAIEAARAGEQGRGFAVVADEVRSLAQKTQHSTEEIERIVNELQHAAGDAHGAMLSSQDSVQATVETSAKVSDSLENIRANITTINDMNTQIATAAEEQSSVAGELSERVEAINDLSSNVAGNANVVSDNAKQLGQESNILKKLINKFRV